MTAQPSSDRPRRHPIGWSLTFLWAAFWVIGGIGTGLDPADSTGPAAAIALAIGFGLAPVVPFWLRWLRQRGEDRARLALQATEDQRRAQEERATRRAGASAALLASIPEDLRTTWEQLEDAGDLVRRVAGDGWVEGHALDQVDARIERLRQLAIADGATDALGGRSSTTVRAHIEELTRLLVALADEAVERQAVVDSADPVPAALRDAQERLLAERRAYLELGDPSAALSELRQGLEGRPQEGA